MRKIWIAGLILSTMFVSSAQAADTEINQVNNKFDPDAVTINAGDTLLFKNSDTYSHNVTVTNPQGEKSDKGMMKPGADPIKYTFRDPGEYAVRCSVHPMM